MSTETEHKPSGRQKRTAYRLSKDGKWRSFSRVPHLLQYANSGTYFARIKVRGKILRESLDTDVWSIAQLWARESSFVGLSSLAMPASENRIWNLQDDPAHHSSWK